MFVPTPESALCDLLVTTHLSYRGQTRAETFIRYLGCALLTNDPPVPLPTLSSGHGSELSSRFRGHWALQIPLAIDGNGVMFLGGGFWYYPTHLFLSPRKPKPLSLSFSYDFRE
jgi:hypothetical protein